MQVVNHYVCHICEEDQLRTRLFVGFRKGNTGDWGVGHQTNTSYHDISRSRIYEYNWTVLAAQSNDWIFKGLISDADEGSGRQVIDFIPAEGDQLFQLYGLEGKYGGDSIEVKDALRVKDDKL